MKKTTFRKKILYGACLLACVFATVSFAKTTAVDNTRVHQKSYHAQQITDFSYLEDIEAALDIHNFVQSRLNPRLREYDSTKNAKIDHAIDEARLDSCDACNVARLAPYFKNPDEVWEKIKARAEEKYASISGDVGLPEGGKSGSAEEAKQSVKTEDYLGVWDLGHEILMDLYNDLDKWGDRKSYSFPLWQEQKDLYDAKEWNPKYNEIKKDVEKLLETKNEKNEGDKCADGLKETIEKEYNWRPKYSDEGNCGQNCCDKNLYSCYHYDYFFYNSAFKPSHDAYLTAIMEAYKNEWTRIKEEAEKKYREKYEEVYGDEYRKASSDEYNKAYRDEYNKAYEGEYNKAYRDEYDRGYNNAYAEVCKRAYVYREEVSCENSGITGPCYKTYTCEDETGRNKAKEEATQKIAEKAKKIAVDRTEEVSKTRASQRVSEKTREIEEKAAKIATNAAIAASGGATGEEAANKACPNEKTLQNLLSERKTDGKRADEYVPIVQPRPLPPLEETVMQVDGKIYPKAPTLWTYGGEEYKWKGNYSDAGTLQNNRVSRYLMVEEEKDMSAEVLELMQSSDLLLIAETISMSKENGIDLTGKNGNPIVYAPAILFPGEGEQQLIEDSDTEYLSAPEDRASSFKYDDFAEMKFNAENFDKMSALNKENLEAVIDKFKEGKKGKIETAKKKMEKFKVDESDVRAASAKALLEALEKDANAKTYLTYNDSDEPLNDGTETFTSARAQYENLIGELEGLIDEYRTQLKKEWKEKTKPMDGKCLQEGIKGTFDFEQFD